MLGQAKLVEGIRIEECGAAALADITVERVEIVASALQRGDAASVGRAAVVDGVRATRLVHHVCGRGAIIIATAQLAAKIARELVKARALVVARGGRRVRHGQPACVGRHVDAVDRVKGR